MKTFKRLTGDKGEKIVAKYLKKHKYKVLERNFETRYGEIDIICKNKECLCFVEVKTRKAGSLFRPYLAVNRNKQLRIIKSAYAYLKKNPCEDRMYRFDIAEVLYDEDGEMSINYIENAFSI